MLKEGLKYDKAFDIVKKERGIVSPNLGFVVQLMTFYQRVFEGYPKLLVQPKVFAVSSHQLEDPQTIVARLLSDEPLYTGKNILKLDPRGIFIISSDKVSFIWCGKDLHSSYAERYLELAEEYCQKLTKYEHLPPNPVRVEQGQEPPELWAIFGLAEPPSEKYAYNRFWDNWYLNLSDVKSITSRSNRSRIEYAEREELEERPTGFLYPNYIEPLYVMELDDLFDDSFMIVCNKETRQVHVWKGPDFQEEKMVVS